MIWKTIRWTVLNNITENWTFAGTLNKNLISTYLLTHSFLTTPTNTGLRGRWVNMTCNKEVVFLEEKNSPWPLIDRLSLWYHESVQTVEELPSVQVPTTVYPLHRHLSDHVLQIQCHHLIVCGIKWIYIDWYREQRSVKKEWLWWCRSWMDKKVEIIQP